MAYGSPFPSPTLPRKWKPTRYPEECFVNRSPGLSGLSRASSGTRRTSVHKLAGTVSVATVRWPRLDPADRVHQLIYPRGEPGHDTGADPDQEANLDADKCRLPPSQRREYRTRRVPIACCQLNRQASPVITGIRPRPLPKTEVDHVPAPAALPERH
jgi:hypothetical protein